MWDEFSGSDRDRGERERESVERHVVISAVILAIK
jgi:hypothetical protein